MSLILFLFAIAATIWGLYALRQSSMLIQCFAVIIAGSVIGYSFFNHQIGPIPITIDRVFFAVVVIQAGIIIVWHRQPIVSQLQRIDLLILSLWLVLTISTLMHDFRYKENLPLGRLLFLNWLPMLMYFVVRFSKISVNDLKALFWVMAVFGVYLSATAILEVFGPQSVVFPGYIASTEKVEFLGRARGPFLNPVSCGVFQVVCFSAAMMLWPHFGRFTKSTLVILLPLFMAGVFLTLTRSIWLTAIWAGVIVFWVPANLKQKVVMASTAVLLLMVSLVLIGDRINSFKRDKHVTAHEMSQSAKLRPMLATIAWRMFQDRPLFGCGFGQYTKYKKPYHYESDSTQPLRMVLPYMQHNVVLSYVTETGLLGLGLLMAVLISFVKRGWDLWRSKSVQLVHRQVGLLMMIVVSSYLINGMFHDVSIIPMIGTLLYFMGGLTVNLGHPASAWLSAKEIRPTEGLEPSGWNPVIEPVP